jgi:hypothetical protein
VISDSNNWLNAGLVITGDSNGSLYANTIHLTDALPTDTLHFALTAPPSSGHWTEFIYFSGTEASGETEEANVTIDGIVSPVTGMGDYIVIDQGPAVVSSTTGDQNSSTHSQGFGQIQYVATLRPTPSFAVSWAWSILLSDNLGGTYPLPQSVLKILPRLNSPQSGAPLGSAIITDPQDPAWSAAGVTPLPANPSMSSTCTIRHPFSLPHLGSNRRWRTDANGNIYAWVTATCIDINTPSQVWSPQVSKLIGIVPPKGRVGPILPNGAQLIAEGRHLINEGVQRIDDGVRLLERGKG